ncbi:MAG: type I DNA topoisomerase [Chloroflexi bacterium]|nr:type I DNA topoisomerase [Chloroflexota bacterium]
MTETTTAYCFKCHAKREIQNPEAVYTAAGRAATKGQCPVCGTTLFRMGETPAHKDLPKPTVVAPAVRKRAKGQPRAYRRPRGDAKIVIVESPAKARTVSRFLGKEYDVYASVGHVRDLLRSQLSVDVSNDFEPKYRVLKEKREVVQNLQQAVREAREVYLATDPDREGEAIAWHLLAAVKIPEEIARRVVFHEITQSAIEEAFQHPRGINMDLVNAQQARRILDRLVGYKISPLLWQKVRSRLSAGRVQSVALRLIVEREREIMAFVPVEYWSIAAELAKQESRGQEVRPSFIAKLVRIRGEEVDLKNQTDTLSIVEELEKSAYLVTDVRKRERQRKPPAPFITSTMQQEASRQLGFTAKRTMAQAQSLYEGVELGPEGSVGLITYMRTDSTAVAEVAQKEARDYISEKYGQDYLPSKPPVHKTRAKIAQEAHECIRPTSVRREPWAIRDYLTKDQYRLYELIWKRFVASQMAAAILDTTSVDIHAGRVTASDSVADANVDDHIYSLMQQMPYLFRATGSVVKFPGFLMVYEEAKDEDVQPEEGEGAILPPLRAGEFLDLLRLLPEQHFTQPPPRYTEASLVRVLEEYGIGRPSTYAPILSTIQARGYVERDGKRLFPTELGFIVNDLVVEHFPDIVDVGFTAGMENDLDLIANGKRNWVQVLREFYGPFERAVQAAEANMKVVDPPQEETGQVCEKCGRKMIVKWGRYGKFLACSGFPECRNAKPYATKVGVNCPQCGGDLVERKTRKNRVFYGCANYPSCNFATWNRPVREPCPSCGGLMTEAGKDKVKCTQCESVFERAEEPERETAPA